MEILRAIKIVAPVTVEELGKKLRQDPNRARWDYQATTVLLAVLSWRAQRAGLTRVKTFINQKRRACLQDAPTLLPQAGGPALGHFQSMLCDLRATFVPVKTKIKRSALVALTSTSFALAACAPAPVPTITCSNPEPVYPMMSFKQGEEGDVLVKLRIGTDGSVADANVIKSSGYPRLDAAALKAARETRCTPFRAPKEGELVPVIATKPYKFRLALEPTKTPS